MGGHRRQAALPEALRGGAAPGTSPAERGNPRITPVAGLLVLAGGAELTPGNEAQDELMVRGAPPGRTAFVVPTAAGPQGRAAAVGTAQRWFADLGLALEELPVLTRSNAFDPVLADRARNGGLFHLVGGAPGRLVEVLRGSPVWAAIVQAWRRGAVIAGSSAGAMAMCDWVLVRATWPDRTARRLIPGLGLVPDCAVVPHFDTFGSNWSWTWNGDTALGHSVVLGVDERTAAVWDRGLLAGRRSRPRRRDRRRADDALHGGPAPRRCAPAPYRGMMRTPADPGRRAEDGLAGRGGPHGHGPHP